MLNNKLNKKIEAVIFDWAGTIIDFGCLAPVSVFVDVFKKLNVNISLDQARGPMGIHKRQHLEKILEINEVQNKFQQVHHRASNDKDIDFLFAELMQMQLNSLPKYANLIPGALHTFETLKALNIKIGTTTGYIKEMTDINLKIVKEQGFIPDFTISASEVNLSRPYPQMCLYNMLHLNVSNVRHCIKVDDTVPGIEEGLNAGMWTIGVTASGNEVGLSLNEFQKLSKEAQKEKCQKAAEKLLKSGAHFVIDTVADLIPCLELIEAKLISA